MELDVNRVRINLQNLEAQHHEFLTLHVQQLNVLRFLMAAATFVQAKGVAQAGGRGAAETDQFAVTSLKGRVAVQATLVVMKEITGTASGYCSPQSGWCFSCPTTRAKRSRAGRVSSVSLRMLPRLACDVHRLSRR